MSAALIYTDALFATSETFVTALVDVIGEAVPDLSIVTHHLLGAAAPGPRVTVLPKDHPRWDPRWAAARAFRWGLGRELFESGLARALERRVPAVVHAQFGQPGYHLYRAIGRSRIPRPRLVVNFYGYDATGLPLDVPAWRARYAELFSYPDLAVVAEGPVMKSRLEALGCPDGKLHVVPLCLNLDPSRRRATPLPAPAGHGPRLGLVGRFVEKKGFLFALRYLAQLLKARDDLRLVLIGDGPERPLIEGVIADNRLGGRVTLAGMLPYEAMLAELGRMTALLVPSLTGSHGDSEGGAPTIVSEAQLFGTPVIASDHADIPFALVDHAYMLKEGDGASLVDAVTRFLRDGGGAYDAALARERVLQRHDRRRLQERYLEIYRGGRSG